MSSYVAVNSGRNSVCMPLVAALVVGRSMLLMCLQDRQIVGKFL